MNNIFEYYIYYSQVQFSLNLLWIEENVIRITVYFFVYLFVN